MAGFIDIAGQAFGRLKVVSRSAMVRKTGALWDCLCECGKTTTVDSLKLRTGKIVSCGCKKAEGQSNYRHGQANATRTYKSWKNMRFRCSNPNSTQWEWYGGRGITVCARWNDYSLFLADMGERPEGTTIDRIEGDKGYEPGNCRWATGSEQATTNRGVKRKGSAAPNKMPEGTVEAMMQMRKDGLSLDKISAATGYHRSVISTKLCAEGRSK